MDLDKIVEITKMLARPYRTTNLVLALLLVLSILGNIYLATKEIPVLIDQDYDNSDFNEVDVE
jgi:hypothetical protein